MSAQHVSIPPSNVYWVHGHWYLALSCACIQSAWTAASLRTCAWFAVRRCSLCTHGDRVLHGRLQICGIILNIRYMRARRSKMKINAFFTPKHNGIRICMSLWAPRVMLFLLHGGERTPYSIIRVMIIMAARLYVNFQHDIGIETNPYMTTWLWRRLRRRRRQAPYKCCFNTSGSEWKETEKMQFIIAFIQYVFVLMIFSMLLCSLLCVHFLQKQ